MAEKILAWADRQFGAIQGGSGVDQGSFPDSLKGEIARGLWSDTTFSYGMEYGYLLALLHLRRELAPGGAVSFGQDFTKGAGVV